MTHRRIPGASIAMLGAVLAAAFATAPDPARAQGIGPHPVVSYSAKARFADVRDELKAAIEARGLVIDFESFVHRMLERTGRDVGSPRPLYLDARAFVFCSAALSRRTMEADPANVAMCPYSITVHSTVQDPERVVVSYRRPWRPDGSVASKAALGEVELLLDAIARDALGLKK